MPDDRLDELYDRYLDGEITPIEEAELVTLLRDPQQQKQWRTLAFLEGKLQEEMGSATDDELDEGGRNLPTRVSKGWTVLRDRKSSGRLAARRRRSNVWPYLAVASGVLLIGRSAVHSSRDGASNALNMGCRNWRCQCV